MTLPTTQAIRLLIVDDHAVVRQGLRTFLELQDGPAPSDPADRPIQVVGEAENGRQAIELSARFQPDVILLDLVMPEMDGLQAAPLILEKSPQSRILILTSFGEEDKVIPALRLGVQGYLLKDIPPDELVKAIRQAARGQTPLHPEIARKLISTVASGAGSPPAGREGRSAGDLTDREGEVLRHLAAGLSNHAIAEKLFISEKTVKTHVSSILSKLGLEDRTQAAIYALKHGLGPEEG